jgi:hypothetical protein
LSKNALALSLFFLFLALITHKIDKRSKEWPPGNWGEKPDRFSSGLSLWPIKNLLNKESKV